VRHENAAAERLGGALARQDAREALPKRAAAIPAPELARLQFQHAMPQSPTLVPRLPDAFIFDAQTAAVAVRAGFRPGMPGRNPDLPRDLFDACNLKSRQAQYRFWTDQNISPQECFTSRGRWACPH
jgi:hypothetical protein